MIGGQLALPPVELGGIHEVQVGRLENRNDDEAVAEFNAIYERWHRGELEVPLPGGETGSEVLDRYLPVLTELRLRYLDDHDFHGDIVVVSHGGWRPPCWPASRPTSRWTITSTTPSRWR